MNILLAVNLLLNLKLSLKEAGNPLRYLPLINSSLRGLLIKS